MEAAARHASQACPGAPTSAAVQEQRRRQGRLVRHARELPDARDAVRRRSSGPHPVLVTRQVITGSGRVGIGQSGDEAGFQLSQRADYIEVEVGLETTLKRGIINTRDEPHADADKYRRLHVIIGDANLAEISTYLKVGTTALVLWLLEAARAAWNSTPSRWPTRWGRSTEVSHDLSLTHRLTLADGRELTALEIQRVYLDVVAPRRRQAGGTDPRAADMLERVGGGARPARHRPDGAAPPRWSGSPSCAPRGMRRATDLPWDHPSCAALDLQWSDVRPDGGSYNRLVAAGSVERLVTRRRRRRRRPRRRLRTPAPTSGARGAPVRPARSRRRAGSRVIFDLAR